MSLYIYIYLLLVMAFWAAIGKRRLCDHDRILYYFLFAILSALLLFRYGQGSDYTNYRIIYDEIYNQIYSSEPSVKKIHGEIGWRLLNQLFIVLGIKYQYLVMLVSVIELWMVHRFVSDYCKGTRCAALLLLYPMFYLTYMFSALRQGLVMCIFLGYMLPLLEKRRYVIYILATLFCGMIHSAAFLYLLLLPVRRMKVSHLEWCCVCGLIIGLIINYTGQGTFFTKFMPPAVAAYMKNIGLSWFALGEKMIMACIIAYMAHHMDDDSEFLLQIYKIYVVGAGIYFVSCWMPLVAGRLFFLWKFVEVVIVTRFMQHREKLRQVLMCGVLMLNSVMFFKNINGYIMEGRYKEHVKIWNYPYISLFDKDKLTYYRSGDRHGAFENGEYFD